MGTWIAHGAGCGGVASLEWDIVLCLAVAHEEDSLLCAHSMGAQGRGSGGTLKR